MPAMIVYRGSRIRGLAFVFTLVTLAVASVASRTALGQAVGQEDARSYNQKATAAFALGKYAAAAEYFEKAFELKPDPALLYNAAQAHRMAGDKERALALYQNYLRVYGGGQGQRADVERKIEELKKAIEHDKEVATSPPTNTQPIGGPTPAETAPPPSAPGATSAVVPPPAAPAPAAPAATLVDRPKDNGEQASITSKPWFWAVVGGGVVVAAVVTIVVLSGGKKDPSPSIGVVP
jgi:tetratricopeptide (TPR) repeat protein